MLYSADRRLLVIHVQKTGGTSVRRALTDALPDLRELAPKHGGWTTALKSHPELAGCFTMGVVRNPWERLVSWWSMIRQAHTTPQKPKHPEFLRTQPFWQHVHQHEDFNDFVSWIPTSQFPRLRQPQLAYLTHNGREVDFIGRTETLTEDMTRLLAVIGAGHVEIPRGNASRHGDYREMYTSETARLVGKMFRPDIRRFGYEFAAPPEGSAEDAVGSPVSQDT